MNPAERSLALARMLDGTSITLLSLTEGGETLTLRRHPGGVPEAVPIPVLAPATEQVVAAPCAGVFLPAHPLRTDSFVEVGAPIEAGAVLGLLQIGPLLVEVRAPGAGTVSAVGAASGELVGFGAALFRIAREERG